MAKLNFFKSLQMGMKYGGVILLLMAKANQAIADGVLEPHEIADLVQTTLAGADIPGVNADKVLVELDGNGGFRINFPKEAIENWNVELDMG